MNRIPIAFAFDNNLILPACVCLSSLLANAKEDTFYDIFILYSQSEKLKKDALNKLALYFKNYEIHYRIVDDTFDAAYQIRGINTVTYYRLLIPELIPEYDKIIYSDVDVIFQDDLSNLFFSTDLNGYYLAGVNSLAHLMPGMKAYYERFRIDSTANIYAGNLIINSKALLQDEIIKKFKEHAQKQYQYQDMDIINIVCAGKIKYLSPSFCVTNYFMDFALNRKNELLALWSEQEIQNAIFKGIIHYNGPKPWKGYCINFDIWWEYYRKSPFFDEKFYYDFFENQINALDRLSLWKRIKILIRYFIFGRTQK